MSIRRKLLSILIDVEHSYELVADSSYTGKYFYCQCKYDGQIVSGTWSITSGGQYATINQNGRVDIVEGTVNQQITVSCTYLLETETKTITVTYDNQLLILCADQLTGTSGNAVAQFNSTVVQGTWSITSGQSCATIDQTGAITILSTGNVTIQCVYQSYTQTKNIIVIYQSNVTTQTEVDESGAVTTTTTTTTTNPDGSTTEQSQSQTVNDDGSTSTTQQSVTTDEDGSYTSQTTTVNQDGTSSETQSQGNADGSSTTTTTNYDEEGDPTTGSNNSVDTSGNSHTQTVAYDEQGETTVTSYVIDTSGNPDGYQDITGNGVNTEFTPFDGSGGFIIHFRFYSKKSEQPVPPLVYDPEDKNYHYNMIIAKSPWTPWYGFHLRWTGNPQTSTDTKLHFGCTFEGDSRTSDVTKNQNSNGIYDITITYDPNGDADGYYFKVRDNINNNWWRRDKKLFRDMENLVVNLGFGISQAGTPYRYSNIEVYDFSVNKYSGS